MISSHFRKISSLVKGVIWFRTDSSGHGSGQRLHDGTHAARICARSLAFLDQSIVRYGGYRRKGFHSSKKSYKNCGLEEHGADEEDMKPVREGKRQGGVWYC